MEAYIVFFNRYIVSSIQMLMGFYFFGKFLKKKGKRYSYPLFAALGVVLVHVAPAGSIDAYLVYTLFLIAAGLVICRAGWESVILYAALTVEITELSFGIVNSVSGILQPWADLVHRNAAAVISILMGSMSLVLAVLCYRTAYRYFSYYETVEKQYLLMILIPVLMIFFMDEYISSILYGNIVLKNAGGSGISVNHYHMLVIQLFGMASLFCLMFAYKKLLQNFHLSTELSRYEKTKSFRHDIKNHITVVKELLHNEKPKEALAYISDMADMTEELSFPCSTGNPVADILVGNKLGIAKSMGIDVECSLRLPYPCPVRDIDFCIILSNALDNAIRACRNVNGSEGKYIRVSGRIQGDFILLEVENGFRGKGTAERGTGLSNIKAVAEKYQGAMSVKIQDGSFILSVLLVIPRHVESIPQQIG